MKTNDRFVDIDNVLKDLQQSISKLKAELDTRDFEDTVGTLRKDLYEGISRWGSVEVARNPGRPCADDYISGIFDDFMELHGDRTYEDDPALVGGLATLDGTSVMVLAHRKHRKGFKDYPECRFGMASPSGHHKAVRLLKLAEKASRPVITLVDTPGGYPDPEAEYKGQAMSIARCIATIADLRTPVIACIVGEAGSGGALALGFGDRIIMLENAFYSAISPEGYSSIIFGDASNREVAADSLKGTGRDLDGFGLVDCLVKEPVGGAHNDCKEVVESTKKAITSCLSELKSMDLDEIMQQRSRRIENLIPGLISQEG